MKIVTQKIFIGAEFHVHNENGDTLPLHDEQGQHMDGKRVMMPCERTIESLNAGLAALEKMREELIKQVNPPVAPVEE